METTSLFLKLWCLTESSGLGTKLFFKAPLLILWRILKRFKKKVSKSILWLRESFCNGLAKQILIDLCFFHFQNGIKIHITSHNPPLSIYLSNNTFHFIIVHIKNINFFFWVKENTYQFKVVHYLIIFLYLNKVKCTHSSITIR